MPKPIMPMATAVWLVDNTSLTFEQIAEFCELHILQVRGIADGEVAGGIIGVSPLGNNQLTREEIDRCEKDAKSRLRMNAAFAVYLEKNKKKGRYTPVARRQNKPDAIAWLTKNYPEITDGKIIKIIGTTKKTVQSIRDKSHWNWANITPKDPVLAGFCTQQEMNALISDAEKIREKLRAETEQSADISEGALSFTLPAREGAEDDAGAVAVAEETASPHDARLAEERMAEAMLSEEQAAAEERAAAEEEKPASNPMADAERLFAKPAGENA